MIKLRKYADRANPIIIIAGGIKTGRTAVAEYIRDTLHGYIVDTFSFFKNQMNHPENLTKQDKNDSLYSTYFKILKKLRQAEGDSAFARTLFDFAEAPVVPVILDSFHSFADFSYAIKQFPKHSRFSDRVYPAVLPVYVHSDIDSRAQRLYEEGVFKSVRSKREAQHKIETLDKNHNVPGIKSRCKQLEGVFLEDEGFSNDKLDEKLEIMMRQLQGS